MSTTVELCLKEYREAADSVNIFGQVQISRIGISTISYCICIYLQLQGFMCAADWFLVLIVSYRKTQRQDLWKIIFLSVIKYWLFHILSSMVICKAVLKRHSSALPPCKVHVVEQWPDDLESMCILTGFMNVCLVSCCWHISPLKQESHRVELLLNLTLLTMVHKYIHIY